MLCWCLFSVFFSVKMSTATKRDHTMLLQPPWLRESYATQMSVMVLIPGINKALVFALDLDSCLLYSYILYTNSIGKSILKPKKPKVTLVRYPRFSDKRAPLPASELHNFSFISNVVIIHKSRLKIQHGNCESIARFFLQSPLLLECFSRPKASVPRAILANYIPVPRFLSRIS